MARKASVRFKELLLVIVVGAAALIAVFLATTRGTPLTPEAIIAKKALLGRWVPYEANFVEAYTLSNLFAKKDTGPLGIWWFSGYQIQRANTNDNIWTLYRVHSVGWRTLHGVRWRSRLTAVTNSP